MATESIIGTLRSEVWDKILDVLQRFVEARADLRQEQSKNAPFPDVMVNGTVVATAVTVFSEAVSGQQTYSFAVVVFSEAAGAGRYSINGLAPKADGTVGIPIPSGFSTITIFGYRAIQSFQMIAETGQTLPFAYQLFR